MQHWKVLVCVYSFKMRPVCFPKGRHSISLIVLLTTVMFKRTVKWHLHYL